MTYSPHYNMGNDHLDQINYDIRKHRLAQWNEKDGLRPGDFVILDDGERVRVAAVYDDHWQPESKTSPNTYYFGDGYLSHSGGLGTIRLLKLLEPTGSFTNGTAWIFNHNDRKAYNDINIHVLCRVFKEMPIL